MVPGRRHGPPTPVHDLATVGEARPIEVGARASFDPMRTLKALVLVAATLVLVACGDPTMTGTWSGNVTVPGGRGGTPMLLTLIEEDGVLSGEAFMVFMSLSVTGTREGAEASMTLAGDLLAEPTPLEGTLDKDVFTGRWWGPGASEPATFRLERD